MKTINSVFLTVLLLCLLAAPSLQADETTAGETPEPPKKLDTELKHLRNSLRRQQENYRPKGLDRAFIVGLPAFRKTEEDKAALRNLLSGAGPEELAKAENLYQGLDRLARAEAVFLKENKESLDCLERYRHSHKLILESLGLIRAKADDLVLGRRERILQEIQPADEEADQPLKKVKAGGLELVEIETEPASNDLELARLGYKARKAAGLIERRLYELRTVPWSLPYRQELELIYKDLNPSDPFVKTAIQDLRNLPNLIYENLDYLDHQLPALLRQLTEDHRRAAAQLELLDEKTAEMHEAINLNLDLIDDLRVEVRSRPQNGRSH